MSSEWHHIAALLRLAYYGKLADCEHYATFFPYFLSISVVFHILLCDIIFLIEITNSPGFRLVPVALSMLSMLGLMVNARYYLYCCPFPDWYRTQNKLQNRIIRYGSLARKWAVSKSTLPQTRLFSTNSLVPILMLFVRFPQFSVERFCYRPITLAHRTLEYLCKKKKNTREKWQRKLINK